MKLNVIILIVLLFTIMSCKKEEPTIQQKEPQVEEFELLMYVGETTLPPTMFYGDTIVFTMYFGNSPCHKSVYLKEGLQDTIISIKIYSKYLPERACVDTDYYYAINYSFTPKARGTYIFKFGQTENSFLMDTLMVQ